MIVLISCSLVEVLSAASHEVPSGTIEFTGGSVAAGIGYTWGKGILIFEGKHYPLKVDGLSAYKSGWVDIALQALFIISRNLWISLELTLRCLPVPQSRAVEVRLP